VLDHATGGTLGNVITHDRDPETNDLIGYTGGYTGIAIEAPAGSIVAFTSYNLHCSGANKSQDLRRVFLPQYASAPIINTQTGEQLNLAVPFLKNDTVVYERSEDKAAKWGGIDGPQG